MTPTAYPLSRDSQDPQSNIGIESHSIGTFDSASESHSIRTHRRFGWRKPAIGPGKRRRPPVIDATASALVRGLEQRLGGLYHRLSRHTVIAGYSRGREREQGRRRRWRSDGVESVLGMLVALVYSADVRSGYIGRPRKGGPGWERYGIEDLARFAYGSVDDATLKRASRALFVISGLGVLATSAQPRTTLPTGEVRGEFSHRKLVWERLCDLCGTTWLLRKDRAALDRKYAPAPRPQQSRPAVTRPAAERVALTGKHLAEVMGLLSEAAPAPPRRR